MSRPRPRTPDTLMGIVRLVQLPSLVFLGLTRLEQLRQSPRRYLCMLGIQMFEPSDRTPLRRSTGQPI